MPSGLTIQTFGDRINLHMHLHFLVTEGGVDEAAVSPVLMNRKRFMSADVFHKIPRIDDSRLAEIFAREVSRRFPLWTGLLIIWSWRLWRIGLRLRVFLSRSPCRRPRRAGNILDYS
jgi:hypothetical protein